MRLTLMTSRSLSTNSWRKLRECSEWVKSREKSRRISRVARQALEATGAAGAGDGEDGAAEASRPAAPDVRASRERPRTEASSGARRGFLKTKETPFSKASSSHSRTDWPAQTNRGTS